jgi:hypothetical protein
VRQESPTEIAFPFYESFVEGSDNTVKITLIYQHINLAEICTTEEY